MYKVEILMIRCIKRKTNAKHVLFKKYRFTDTKTKRKRTDSNKQIIKNTAHNKTTGEKKKKKKKNNNNNKKKKKKKIYTFKSL